MYYRNITVSMKYVRQGVISDKKKLKSSSPFDHLTHVPHEASLIVKILATHVKVATLGHSVL